LTNCVGYNELLFHGRYALHSSSLSSQWENKWGTPLHRNVHIICLATQAISEQDLLSMMFSLHYHFNWELAVLVTADRDADQQINVPKVLSKIHKACFSPAYIPRPAALFLLLCFFKNLLHNYTIHLQWSCYTWTQSFALLQYF